MNFSQPLESLRPSSFEVGKIVIEAADAPAAQSVRYMMTQIEELLAERDVTADVDVRVSRNSR